MKPALLRQRHTVIVLAIGLGLTGFAALAAGQGRTSHADDDAASQPVRCELRISAHRGQTVIGGLVSSDRAVQGSYRLDISNRSSGGVARINQSGVFAAFPDAPAHLGETVLGGGPSQYRAELEVSFEGGKLHCRQGSGPQLL